ncbi:hypothetical protein RQP46_008533 [Phenoliferia psychrophenolica]
MSTSSDASAIKALHEAVAIQKAAFLKDQDPTLAVRVANLHKIAAMVTSNRQLIREALNEDFGSHPDGLTDLVEVMGPAGRAMFVASQLEEWMKDEPRFIDPALFGNGTAVVRREAKGVIGNIVPFNFPFDLSVGPLVEQLAAGNRVIIKPSELTPACGALLKKMVNATFPTDLVEVVNGGMDLSIEFSKVKWDHLLYTGSSSVGKLIMAECAKQLVPCTLELGGKNPAVFYSGAVTAEKVNHLIGIKMLKNGQMCISIDTVYVPAKDVDEFVRLAVAFVATLQGYAKSLDCTGMISMRHLERIQRMLAEAKASGAKVIPLDDGEVDLTTRRMPLSVVVDPSSSLDISKEEIFGPILVVRSYEAIASVVAEINDGERPLGLYVFGNDEEEIQYVLRNTKSGGAAINGCALQGALPSLGFGGTGNSGMGRHHGLEGFREFTNPKGLVRRSDEGVPDLAAAFGPPYAAASGLVDHILSEAAKAA